MVTEQWAQRWFGDEHVLEDDLREFVIDWHVGGVGDGMWNGGHEFEIACGGVEPCFSVIWVVTIGFKHFFKGRLTECG